jgi:hypothetical protein
METKITRENITRHLIEYQLAMVGKSMMDTLDDDKWYFNITMTQEQHEEFKRYAIPLLKKIFKFNKAKAEQTFDWFDLQFGLRIKN